MSESLNDLIAKYQQIEQQIFDAGGEITAETEELLANAEGNIGQKLDSYAGFIAYCNGQAEYLKKEAEQYSVRSKMFLNVSDEMRSRMMYALKAVGLEGIKTSIHGYSLRESESWKIKEGINRDKKEDLVRNGCAEMIFKPSISAIKSFYKGKAPDFVEVISKTSITIR